MSDRAPLPHRRGTHRRPDPRPCGTAPAAAVCGAVALCLLAIALVLAPAVTP